MAVHHEISVVLSFSDTHKVIWTNPVQKDSSIAVLLDTSASMRGFENEMRMILSAFFCVSDVPRVNFPVPSGGTALVDSVDALLSRRVFEGLGGATNQPQFEKIVVITDGCDTASRGNIIEGVDKDGNFVFGTLPGLGSRRDATVASHFTHIGVEMVVIGIGNQVTDFLRVLDRAKRVRTGHILPGASAAQIIGVMGAVIDSDSSQSQSASMVVSDTVEPAPLDQAASVARDAAHVAFGDSFTVESTRAAIDAAIAAVLATEAKEDEKTCKIVRGLVAHLLWIGASSRQPVPGAIIGGKRSAVFDCASSIKTICNKTLSHLTQKEGLITSMSKASSVYTHTDTDSNSRAHLRTCNFQNASHYTVSQSLSSIVAGEVQKEPWCTPVDAIPVAGGCKRARTGACPL